MNDKDKIDLDLLLQQCESEQLHLSGQIQAFGSLICLDPQTLVITHVAANIEDFLGIPYNQILGKNVEALPWISLDSLKTIIGKPRKSLYYKDIKTNVEGKIGANIMEGPSSIVIELEKTPSLPHYVKIRDVIHTLSSAPHNEEELIQHHQCLVDVVQDITQYDRIMIYRFHDDWTGEVIAESTRNGFGSYLGLHFPASDIPAIARNLYMLNPTRSIPDIKSLPIPIIGIDSTPPDLTLSDLRSVSPIHIQYMENMGIEASLSIPIKMANRLWGLVTCHNLIPRILTPDQRLDCVTITKIYSMALFNYFSGRNLQLIDSLDRQIEEIMILLADNCSLQVGLEKTGPILLELMKAQSFTMVSGNKTVTYGVDAPLEEINKIDAWFLNEFKEAILMTDHLEEFLPNHLILQKICGMVAIKGGIRNGKSGVRFYWLRPEHQHDVTWAGNPDKPIMEREGVTMLSPRRSFEKWVQTKKGYSRPWGNDAKTIALKFRNSFFKWF